MHAGASGRLGALFCLAAAVAAPRNVAAQGFELRYEAFEGCPERDAFAKNLDARRRGATGAFGAVQMEVRLRRSDVPNRVEGSIVVRSSSGNPSARRIVASTCGEAADALALIAALVLQGIEVEEVPATDAPSEGPIDRPSPRRADRARASEPSRSNDLPSEQPAVSEHEPDAIDTAPEPEPRPDAQTTSDRAVTRQDEREILEEEPHAASAPIERSTHVHVLLSGGVASGVLPGLQPLPELSLSVEHGAPSVLTWSAHAAFRISPDQTHHFEQGVVAFGWWTGLAAVCLGTRGAQLAASGCAALEVGTLSGDASDTENPRDEQRAWVALGPGLALAYDITRALRLSLRAEALTPLTRYRLELPGGTAVHEPADLGFRAGLGVGLQLQ